MQLNKKNKIIIVGIIILISGIIFWRQNIFERTLQRKFSVENFRGESENILPGNTFFEINGTRYEGEVKGEISVYDFMSELRKKGRINFVEKNYIGMGKLITEINGVRSDGEKNWIYYVNGVEAQVGVSNYKIKKGDIVSWKYEKANF